MATKIPKNTFTKAFTKTKLGYLLDREIEKGEFEWEYKFDGKEGDTAWHPSSHCMQSPHELYHIAKGELDAFVGPKPYKIFQVGHFWHQYLQEVCIRADLCLPQHVERRALKGWETIEGLWYEGGVTERWLPEHDETGLTPYFKGAPFHWVTGSADIAPCEIPGHGPYLIDFKTMTSHTFRIPSESTLEKWECQINVYMDFFDLERALIVGINKDAPHDFKEWEFNRNDKLIEALYYKWKLVASCLDEETVPPEDETIELPTAGPV